MRLVDRIFWGAALLALPFIFSSGFADQVREPKAAFFAVLVGLYICYRVAAKVSLFLGAAASLPLVWTVLFSSSFHGLDLFVFVAAISSCFFVADASRRDVELGLSALELSGLLCAAYAVLQYVNRDPINHFIPGADHHRVMVFFGQHTLYGPFAVACAAPALFRRHYLRAAFLFWPIFAIDASFTYLSAGVVVAFYLLYEFAEKAAVLIAIAAVLAGGVLAYEYRGNSYIQHDALNDNGRFQLWHVTARIARARPIVGHGGLGSFSEQFRVFQSRDLRRQMGIDESKFSPESKEIMKEAEDLRNSSGWFLSAHNEYLQAFYEYGIFGLIFSILLPLVFFFWWTLNWSSRENWILGAIFFAFIANAIGNFPFHLVPQALLPLWAYVLVVTDRDRGILES